MTDTRGIYRGPGGPGDATNDAASEAILAIEAAKSANDSKVAAAASAGAAANFASTAQTSASLASSQAGLASASATTATTKASEAEASAIAAAADALSTANIFDEFDDIYLGSKTSDPTLDNDGDALQTGAMYFNSVTGEMKVYDGVNWFAINISGGALLAANNLSDLFDASTARSNLGLGTAATTDATDYATAAQGSNADTAYGWGDHATEGYLTSFTETDPIFVAHPSYGITSTNISNWDTAYGWGNHASAGYLTSYTETDPIYTASSWYTTTNNSSNWDTAYGWGNHASAGYLTSYTETDPVYTASSWYTTTNNSSNWDTAFGWGNHASAGYATYPSQTGNAGKYLTTDGTVTSWATVNVNPALDDLSDVVITTPSTDQVLKYNGTNWVNGTSSGGQFFGTAATKAIAYNSNSIAENITTTSGNNSLSVGPITIASGYTVTVASGTRWVIL
jgi:hypothetical protein